jgi:putative SOS response-associated peptidase YedK
MCGRYSLTTAPEALRRLFELDTTPNLEPRYNIAPSQSAPVVRFAAAGAREFAMPRWGLIPSWAKDASIGHKMINARSETVAEKPSFRSAFHRRRCLVPADGFYEWRTEGDIKQPFRIGLAGGGPFAFAGLWESWPGNGDDGGEAIETFTILTTEANRKLHPIHPRMPVILAPEAYQTWLDGRPETTERALSLLRPFAGEKMAFYRVSRRVNSPRNDDPDCLEPISDAGA